MTTVSVTDLIAAIKVAAVAHHDPGLLEVAIQLQEWGEGQVTRPVPDGLRCRECGNLLPLPGVQRLRQRRGWSREQLALQSGVSESALARMEGGRECRVESVIAVGRALGAEVRELIEAEVG